MSRSTLILIAALVVTLPLGEVHRFFHVPELRERDWFLLSDRKQDIEWYLKDSAEAISWILFLGVWFKSIKNPLKGYNLFLVSTIFAFLVYRVLDFAMYWINAREGGLLYTLSVYGTALAAGLGKYKQWSSR